MIIVCGTALLFIFYNLFTSLDLLFHIDLIPLDLTLESHPQASTMHNLTVHRK